MKIRSFIISMILLSIILVNACREDFDYELASNELSFSTDTVSVDTVFNFTSSQTYKFTVHNNQDNDVEIPRIYLSRGESSYFKLNVDGNAGYKFENVPIRAKDSIFIFVEINAGEADFNPLYEDEINFETTNNNQSVKLLSWIEKAEFYQTPDGQDYLDLNNEVWDNSASRVIYGNVKINNSLQVMPGTNVYFYNGGGLTIAENATLNVQGTLGNEARFRGYRHDSRYDSLPNQWDKILLKENSTTIIDYAIIKSGNIGLQVENSNLTIKNTKVFNNELYGIYAIGATINGENVAINNSSLSALAIDAGGSYQFIHSTFANYFNIGSSAGGNYSLYLSNTSPNGNNTYPLTQATFANCIFYGRAANAILFDSNDNAPFTYSFINNLIRNENTNEMNIANLTGFSQTIFDDPLFIDAGFGNNNLRVNTDENSPAIAHGNSTYASQVPNDIVGVNRLTNPTVGCYQ